MPGKGLKSGVPRPGFFECVLETRFRLICLDNSSTFQYLVTVPSSMFFDFAIVE
jgi:hypothetical protein